LGDVEQSREPATAVWPIEDERRKLRAVARGLDASDGGRLERWVFDRRCGRRNSGRDRVRIDAVDRVGERPDGLGAVEVRPADEGRLAGGPEQATTAVRPGAERRCDGAAGGVGRRRRVPLSSLTRAQTAAADSRTAGNSGPS
jgi:hypothetical protein